MIPGRSTKYFYGIFEKNMFLHSCVLCVCVCVDVALRRISGFFTASTNMPIIIESQVVVLVSKLLML